MAEVEPIVLEHKNGREEDSLTYESDSDHDSSALALRRCVASDEEGEEDDTSSARRDGYYEQDLEHHEGGPPVEEYEEDEEEDEDEYEDGDDEGILIDGRMEARYDYDNEEAIKDVGNQDREDSRNGHVTTAMVGAIGAALEGKKDAEPFVVPTAGAFYMHDDRFRYNGLTRPRRSPGGRKLWEAKDEKPWLHDRFEELNLHDEGYPIQGGRGRRSRGRQMGILGSRKNAEHARGKSIRERSFDNSLLSRRRLPRRVQGIRKAKMDDYEFRESRVVTSEVLTKTSSHEAASSTPPLQNPASLQSMSNPQDVASKKPTISSMLKVSSPPFFPTGTALHTLSGMAGTNKASEENTERNVSQGKPVNNSRSGMDREISRFPTTSRLTSNPELRSGLTVVSDNGDAGTGFHQSLLALDSSTFHQQVPKPGPGTVTQQQQRVSKAELGIHTVDQPLPISNRALTTAQSLRVPPVPAFSQQTGRAAPLGTQSILLQPVQKLQQMQPMNQTLISSGQAIQPQTMVSFHGKSAIDLKNAPGPPGSNSGNDPLGRGALTPGMQAGRGSVVHGSSSLTNGLRGVVQLAGQPQAQGVPTGGVALPGYSSRPQFSFPNNSEVTWIPILASGGSNYNPSYISMDGISSSMYYTQQTSQASSFQPALGDSNYSKTIAAGNSLKASQRTESDDLGQQRRRYSQMTFGEERR